MNKKTTTTIEYDENGKKLRKIVVEEWTEDLVYPTYPTPWWERNPGWWQYPVITYTGSTTTNPFKYTITNYGQEVPEETTDENTDDTE